MSTHGKLFTRPWVPEATPLKKTAGSLAQVLLWGPTRIIVIIIFGHSIK